MENNKPMNIKATIRLKNGSTIQLSKKEAAEKVKKGEADYVSPIPQKRPQGYQTK